MLYCAVAGVDAIEPFCYGFCDSGFRNWRNTRRNSKAPGRGAPLPSVAVVGAVFISAPLPVAATRARTKSVNFNTALATACYAVPCRKAASLKGARIGGTA